MRLLALLAVAAAIALPVAAATASSSVTTCPFDRQYLQSSIRSSLFSIAGGRIAAARATTPGVQALAQRLVSDHNGALGAAASLARRLHVAVPGNPTAEQHWELNVVAGLSGAAVDRRYAWLVAASVGGAVQDAASAAAGACAAPVRALARSRAALLRSELQLAVAAQKAAA